MTAVEQREPEQGRPPNRSDAERAAAALMSAGVSRVVLFGSVARGEATGRSDIDLVAVYDDMDYGKRFALERELSALAGDEAGRRVDVFATDRPEWKMRSERLSTSLESWIARDGVVLADRGAGEVDWGKEMVTPTSDFEEAVGRLYDLFTGLLELNRELKPDDTEVRDRQMGNEMRAFEQYQVRLEKACGHVQYTVESAIEVLLHVTSRRRVEWQHDIRVLCAELGEPHRSEVLGRLAPVGADEITRWHRESRYGGAVREGSPATPALARAMAAAACGVAAYAVGLFDESTPHTDDIRTSIADIAERLTGCGLETGASLDRETAPPAADPAEDRSGVSHDDPGLPFW